eukprot:gb/GFBE01083088.1/.p1 GENE.gb/GFBE01083088.1/~~gb/GFBE01083088.1/.p1  ORF type:complete len:235 (+),score=60.48 gb/GFBE01083088.1/:1-705(+)
MASDATVLKETASRMEMMTAQLLDSAKASVPDVLIRPALELLGDQKQALYDLIGEAAQSSSSAAESSATNLDSLSALEADLERLVKSQMVELDVEGGPWHNPPALRKFRELGQAISKTLGELKQLRGVLLGRSAGAKDGSRKGPAAAPSMASGSYGRFHPGGASRDADMTVEQALNMLVEKKDPIWKGSLIGIVHAAGVQELTSITSHLPGRFEFVYAPKMQAAWTLHQCSAMI